MPVIFNSQSHPCRLLRRSFQTRENRFDYGFRHVRILHLNRDDTGFLGRIVVAARKDRVADKDHIINRNAQNVRSFLMP